MSTIQQGSFASGSIYRILQWLFLIVAILIVIVTATVGYNAGSRYYWGFTLLILPIVGYLLARRGGRALDLRRKVQFRWARPRPVDEERDSSACRSYFASLGRMEGEVVDDRTWEDLSMDRIVDDMDVCFSLAGRNELYLLLRRCLPSAEEQAGFSRLTDRIRTDEPFRLELLSQLAVLANGSDKDSSELLSSERLVVDPLLPLYITMSAAVFVSFAMPFLLGVGTGLLLIIGVFLTNMWIYYRKSRHITDLVPMLRGLFRLIRQAGRIAEIDFKDTGFDSVGLRENLRATGHLSRSFRSILAGSAAGTTGFSADMVETMAMFLKILFLTDLIAYNRLVSGIRRSLDAVRALYRTVGRLDAAHAVASYIERKAPPGTPIFGRLSGLDAKGLYHPLLEEPVANAIKLALPGAIVTGTNMAGKSTFLRTLGVNAILAQTIGVCFATSYRSGRFLIMSSIEKSDSLEAGKSFYYTEAERIYRMIERVGGEIPVLLLIDELLSGTNSLEREGASVAILKYLASRHALTVAATHDVAIAQRVSDRYDLFYFTDRADSSGLSFDYRIRSGIVKTRNAIKLLALIGYPQDVIDEALAGAKEPDTAE